MGPMYIETPLYIGLKISLFFQLRHFKCIDVPFLLDYNYIYSHNENFINIFIWTE